MQIWESTDRFTVLKELSTDRALLKMLKQDNPEWLNYD